jgi:hypothetical protein
MNTDATAATGAAPEFERWEYSYYQVKWGDFASEIHNMNAAGEEGWELVNGLPVGGSGGTSAVLLLYKRRRR